MGCSRGGVYEQENVGPACWGSKQEPHLATALTLSEPVPWVNCKYHCLDFQSQTSPLLAERNTSLFSISHSTTKYKNNDLNKIYAKKESQSTLFSE